MQIFRHLNFADGRSGYIYQECTFRPLFREFNIPDNREIFSHFSRIRWLSRKKNRESLTHAYFVWSPFRGGAKIKTTKYFFLSLLWKRLREACLAKLDRKVGLRATDQ